MRRVAVTGIGVICPLGNSGTEVYRNACAGTSGVRSVSAAYAKRLGSSIAATAQFDGADHFEPPKLRMMDRVSQMALFAANQALADARCVLGPGHDTSRIGVFLGTGMGGSQSNDDGYQTLYGERSDRIKPFTVLLGMHNAPAAWIGVEHGITGPNITYSTACSSSAVAIGEAWMRIGSGCIDRAITGGSEAPLSFGSLKAWESLHTVARIDAADPSTSCKPFSLDRSGMVLGEGAAILFLEAWDQALDRGVTIHGEILGYGLTTDPGNMVRPSAEGQAAAMQAALRSADLHPSELDAINAHGTGTAANDVVETAAIKAVFGRNTRLPVSSTKAVHGHLLGAAGALECVVSLLAMQHGVLLPTMHLQSPDPECDLDYVPNSVRQAPVRTMLSNSFAFGGTNAVLALGSA